MGFQKKVRRILVIKNRAIGDTILLTGSLRLLRQHRPDHQIHVLVRSPAGELLEGLPYVDRVISAKEPKNKLDRLGYWLGLIRRLREKQYELVLNFHASKRTSATAQFLRAQTCVANHHELKGRNWFSDLPVPGRGQLKPNIDRDLDVLRAIGISATIQDAMPEVTLTDAEKREAKELFARHPAKGPRVFLGIGGSRITKRWPPSHFAELARRLAKEVDAHFVMATIDIDRPWLDRFWPLVQADQDLSSRFVHFSDEPLRQTAKILSQCTHYVGNDSGLKHLAIALGLRTFTFFGPEAPFEWHPYDQKNHPYAYLEPLACRTEAGKHWCSVAVCEKHQHRCMQDIVPDKVWSEIIRIIRG